MLYNKEAAIAAIAIMLVAAPFLGGFLLSPAFAEPKTVTSKTISQDDDESTTVSAVEFDARKVTMRSSGTVFVKIMQDDTELASGTVDTSAIPSSIDFTPVVVNVDDTEVTGDFDIVIQYEGSGGIQVSGIDLSDGETDTAGEQDDGAGNGDDDDGTSTAGGSNSQSLPEGVEIKRVSVENSGETTDLDTVEFTARKATTRSDGTVTVAIVQGSKVLDTTEFSLAGLDTIHYQDMEAAFDVQVTGDYDVVFIFNGKGSAQISGIDVVGPTSPASDDDDDDDDEPNPDGTLDLKVEAFDENGEELSMWIEVWKVTSQGLDMVNAGPPDEYTPHTFNLEAGDYVVAVEDFENKLFACWDDSVKGRNRSAELTHDETFTAIFSVDGTMGNEAACDGTTTAGGDDDTPPGGDDTPPTGGDDTPVPPATGTAGAVTITTTLLDDTTITGYQAQLRDPAGTPVDTQFSPAVFDDMEDGKDYKVVMYTAGDTYFRHWSDGGLHRYRITNTADEGKVFNAEYERVPADQAAHIMVIARTSDGTQIGSTTGSDVDGTLNAEAGLEVTVAPPGSMTPFTAGFSGGSEIEQNFYFAKGHTYVVNAQEFAPYTFSHWEDNGSPNKARAVDLNGDVTLVAIYDKN